MRASAFCPGHVTCIFQPRRHDDPLRSGSRGAGLCLDRGALARVEESSALSVTIDGAACEAPVTREALGLLGETGLSVEIELQLPVAQGFAMSAAGTVAACLAACELRGRPAEEAFRAAHMAELARGGGMGDVAGIMAGGASLRSREGLPPFGETRRLDLDGELLLVVLGPPRSTADLLSSGGEELIELHGGRGLEGFIAEPGWDSLFRRSLAFASGSGLMTEAAADAIARLSPHGQAAMCMLGDSVFFRGDIAAAMDAVAGEFFLCSIDHDGPRSWRGRRT